MSGIQFAPDEGEIERRVEALLFAAAGPLSAADIARRLPEGADAGRAIAALRTRYGGGVSSWNASRTAGGSAPPPIWVS